MSDTESLVSRIEAGHDRFNHAIGELEQLLEFIDPDYIDPDERDVSLLEGVAEAAELGVAKLWDSVRARINAGRRAA
jgi:hypothetical protein